MCVFVFVYSIKNEPFSASRVYIMMFFVLVGDTNIHSIFTLGQLQGTESNDYKYNRRLIV